MLSNSNDKRRFMVEWHEPERKRGGDWSRRYFKYEQRARDCAAKRGGTVWSGFVGGRGWTRLDDTA